jgi:hypothetical protein
MPVAITQATTKPDAAMSNTVVDDADSEQFKGEESA